MTDDLARQRAATVAVWRADAAGRPRGAWSDLGGLAVHSTGLQRVFWNGAHLTSAQGVAALPAARDWFAARGVPWGVLVPAELDVDPGTPHVTTQPVMLRRLEDLPPPADVPLRWDAGEDACAVQAAAFDEPLGLTGEFVLPKLANAACAVVVSHDGDLPVATATLVVADRVAAVYGVGVVRSARRRGLGRAVTLAVLHEGRRRGCDLAYLNPSELGRGVYAALGFADAPGWRVHAGLGEAVRT